MFAIFLLWQATKSSARTAFACGDLKTIETIGTILFLACKQAQEGETDCPYCLYCLLKKNKRAKNNPLVLLFIFCFLRFLYNRLFPIVFSILAFSNYIGFSNCILYIGFFQLYWFFLIVFYILAFPNYIVFFQLYFIYWLLPIILYFSPIVFIQLP